MAKRISKGLGDTVARVTKYTKIDKLVEFVAGEDCGCKERQEKLNKMFPYKTPECLTEVEHEQLTTLLPNMRVKVKPSEQLQFLKVYNRVFKTNEQPTSCASCLNDMLRKMKQVYNAYENGGALLG
jgi:hypothetical protein